MTTGYLLCCSPRSGSTLLCDLLGQTGVAGRPNSFFRPASIADFADTFGLPGTDTLTPAYVDAMRRHATTSNGCFGMRLQSDNLAVGLAYLAQVQPGEMTDWDRLTTALGPLQAVHLIRQDKVAQAVSYARAETSGVWHRHPDGRIRELSGALREPHYDRQAIAHYHDMSIAAEAAWTAWFAQQSVTPIRVTYEQLAADPITTVTTLLRELGLDPYAARHLRPATAKLADALSQDWCARFRADTVLLPPSDGSATPRP